MVHQLGSGRESLLQGVDADVDVAGLFLCRLNGFLVLIHLTTSIVKGLDELQTGLLLFGFGITELCRELSALQDGLRQRAYGLTDEVKRAESTG